MKIAQVCPLAESVPPKLYGGTERIAAYLSDELAALGHDVTLFASGDSATRGKLEAVWPRALRLDDAIRDPLAPHMLMLERVARRAGEFDIIHSHVDYISYPVFRRLDVPFLGTLHGRLDLSELQKVYDLFDDVPVVSISDAQRQPLPQAHYVATVHHGLPERLLRPGFGAGNYLAFLGRISPEKDPVAAIRIAQRSGRRLKIAAKVDRVDEAYFNEVVAPLLDNPAIEFIGEIDEVAKVPFLSQASALLFPICWPEPFGLVMIEAMACGVPVIAFRNGSVPEIIEDGLTGFIVDDIDEAVTVLHHVDRLDRAAIRARFEQRFSARRMAHDYVALYQSLAQRRHSRSPASGGELENA